MSRWDSNPVPAAWLPAPDVARQLATVAAAAAQVILPVVLSPRFDGADQPPNVIQPADYTFAIWFPIFAGSLGYAGYQARPVARDRPVLRRVGWPLAAAFACTGAWAPLLRRRRYWSAQAALIGIATGAEVARRRLVEAEVRGLARAEMLAVVPPTAMLAGWGAAAAGVNLAAMLTAYGVVRPGWQSTATGAAALVALGVSGTDALRADGRSATATATARTYGGTLLWALAGVMAGQRKRSPAAAAAAASAAAPVVWSLAGRPRGR